MKTKQSPSFARGLIKWPVFVPMLLVYLCLSILVAAVPAAHVRRRLRIALGSFASRIALRLFNVRVRWNHRGRFNAARSRGCLIVSNHVSYIDVLAISAAVPAVFITSVELGNTVFLGLLARSAGSLFVERRKASGLKREIDAIAAVLKQGFCVVLFPEATTSNGDCVHPFKRSLFDAAIDAGTDILPVCLRYSAIDGEPVSPDNRDRLFYYGNARFSRHFPGFLTLRSVDLEITPLPLITIREGLSRKDLAAEAHDAISKAYHEQDECK